APLPQADVEKILQQQTNRKPAERKLASQLAEGSPGVAIEMDVELTAQQRRDALRILERAARGQGFAQLFADTSALSKDRESSFEDQIAIFYGLLSDLLELTSGVQEPALRNAALRKDLEILSKSIDSAWVMRAIAGFDELHAGARRTQAESMDLERI